jgi:hypothetical protein
MKTFGGVDMYRLTLIGDQIHDPAALPPAKGTLFPLHRKLGGPERWSERVGGWTVVSLYRDSNSDFLVVQPVTSRSVGLAMKPVVEENIRTTNILLFCIYRNIARAKNFMRTL